jgi:glycosyltransferase involved in cell wall biosynthesis
LRILLSAFSAYSPYGSESLVGHTYARVLGRKNKLHVITCKPTDVTTEMEGIESVHTVDLGGRDFNEIRRGSLLAFELKQWFPASNILSKGVDLIHRVNSCSINDPTFLAMRGCPFVIGPILSSGNPPASFQEIAWREINHHKSTASFKGRLQLGHRLGRLIFDPMLSQWTHLKNARKILVGSSQTMNQIPAELHSRCESIVYAGVEHEIFLPPEPDESTRGVGPTRLLCVGRLKPHKGLELLIKACAQIRKGREFTLTIIGQGTDYYTQFLKNLTAELNLEKIIEWIPSVKRSDLIAVYRHHDIFCFPTLSDTYGIALLEAMSTGLPIVASDIGGPAEIVSDNAGIRIACETPEQYIADCAGALADLIDHPEKRKSLGLGARHRILDRHDWEKIGDQLEKIYEELP